MMMGVNNNASDALSSADLQRPLLLIDDVEAVAVAVCDNSDTHNENELHANRRRNSTVSSTIEEEEEEDESQNEHENAVVDVDADADVDVDADVDADVETEVVIDDHLVRDEDENENENDEIIIIIIKFLIFLSMTFLSIAVVHIIVGQLFNDRDQSLQIWQIIVYEGDSIIRDCFIFFVIGRVYKQQLFVESTSINTICIWFIGILIANLYFECQNYIWFLQHSVSLYEIHCIWPWELWLFAIVVVVLFSSICIAHIKIIYHQKKRNQFKIKIMEILSCLLFFIIPLVVVKQNERQYLHFHHWFAGWFLGMHFNLSDQWWSIGCMAYCYGMYINGIAVYGRDPLLTCDYANFITEDLNCPSSFIETTATMFSYNNDENIDVDDSLSSSYIGMSFNGNMVHAVLSLFLGGDYNKIDINSDPAADWRNCSSNGYHP
jgi:predicted  nucleic acid-binding Zn-ribbon protein